LWVKIGFPKGGFETTSLGVAKGISEGWVKVSFKRAGMQILRTWQILRGLDCHGFGGQ